MGEEQGHVRFDWSRPQELNVGKEAEDKKRVAPRIKQQELGTDERMGSWAEGDRETGAVSGGSMKKDPFLSLIRCYDDL